MCKNCTVATLHPNRFHNVLLCAGHQSVETLLLQNYLSSSKGPANKSKQISRTTVMRNYMCLNTRKISLHLKSLSVLHELSPAVLPIKRWGYTKPILSMWPEVTELSILCQMQDTFYLSRSPACRFFQQVPEASKGILHWAPDCYDPYYIS